MFKTFCSVTFVIYFLRQTNNTVEVEWKLYLSNMISKNLDSQLFYVNQLANWPPVDRMTPDYEFVPTCRVWDHFIIWGLCYGLIHIWIQAWLSPLNNRCCEMHRVDYRTWPSTFWVIWGLHDVPSSCSI